MEKRLEHQAVPGTAEWAYLNALAGELCEGPENTCACGRPIAVDETCCEDCFG